MGGGFNVLPNPNVFLRYEPRPLPGDLISCGPHSIYSSFWPIKDALA